MEKNETNYDFFVPMNNEEELIVKAIQLKIGGAVMLYSFEQFRNKKNLVDSLVNKFPQIKLAAGILFIGKFSEKQFILAQKITEFVVVEASDGLRQMIERFTDFYVYGAEYLAEKDFIHQRDSGLNQVVATAAAKHNVTFLINSSKLISQSGKNKSIVLGRITQNYRILTHYRCNFFTKSFARSRFEIKSDLKCIERILNKDYRL